MTAILLCPGALAGEDDRPAPLGPEARALLGGPLVRAQFGPAHTPAGHDIRELAHESWLRTAFGVAPDASVGAYAGWMAGATDDDWIVRPVHLHLALDHVLLSPPGGLELAGAEADALLATANGHLAGDGIELARAAHGCWRMRCREPLQLRPTGSAAASRRNVFDFLPEGADARRWRGLQSEVQLLWHEHPVNRAREARGELTVNGIWIEGRALRLAPSARFTQVVAQGTVIAGLCDATGTPRLVPASEGAVQAEVARALAAPTQHLFECRSWQQDTLDWNPQQPALGWQELYGMLEPLLHDAPRSAMLDVVLTGREQVLTLRWRGADRWKFWRRLDPTRLGVPRPAEA